MEKRETFSSRLGFILVSAGCAVGIGNVWKFPYICGQFGGAAFILIYLLFLGILGIPILVCEYAVGRSSRKSCAASFQALEPKESQFHCYGGFAMAGNVLLMMFYTTVAGWMMCYFWKCLTGTFTASPMTTEAVASVFSALTADPWQMLFWAVLATVISFGICALGVVNGVERITKWMMVGLLGLIVVLAVNSLLLPGAGEGIRFYLVPNFAVMQERGIGNVIFAAMSQAFFTLSLGIGAMSICGSYKEKTESLTGDAVSVTVLDTFVALMAGMIIIPACFSFGIEPGAGPSLIFITLPNIFNQMAGGRIWGTLFFLFMSFAAISTIITVFENILSCSMDLWHWSRKKAVAINMAAMVLLALPCVLGFNVLSGVQPLGAGSGIMDLEDFIVSNNLLPLGSVVYLCFCVSQSGWGWATFLAEANTGRGMRFPVWLRGYMTYVLPLIVVVIYLKGYWDMFQPKGTGMLTVWMLVAAAFLALIGWIVFGKRKVASGQ